MSESGSLDDVTGRVESLPFRDSGLIFETDDFTITTHDDWSNARVAGRDVSWVLPDEPQQNFADGVLVTVEPMLSSSWDDIHAAVLKGVEDALGLPEVLEQVIHSQGSREVGVLVYSVRLATNKGDVELTFLTVSSLGADSTVLATMGTESSRFESLRARYEGSLLSIHAS